MGLLNLSRNMVADAIIGGTTYTKFNAANAYIAVGNSNAAFDAAQTALQGASQARKGMDSTYPQRTNYTDTFQATFGTTEGNFDWQEWGLVNAAAAGDFLNRKVENNGTKGGTSTWQFTVSVAFNI